MLEVQIWLTHYDSYTEQYIRTEIGLDDDKITSPLSSDLNNKL